MVLGEQLVCAPTGGQSGRSANVAYRVKLPVRRSSSRARAGLRSSSTRRPFESLVATCTPCSFERSWPGTVQERTSAPPSYSNTRERWLSPCVFT